jgi:hypothetical protein
LLHTSISTGPTQRSLLASNLVLAAVDSVRDTVVTTHVTPSLARRIYHQHKSSGYHMHRDRWDVRTEREAYNTMLDELTAVASSKLYGTRANSAQSIQRRGQHADMRHNVVFAHPDQIPGGSGFSQRKKS